MLERRTAMRHRVHTIRGIVNRRVWLPAGQLSGLIHPLPLLAALAVLLVLSSSGQLHEIYAALLEAHLAAQGGIYDLVHVVMAAFSLTLLSAALYFANYSLSDVRIDVLWAEHRDVDRERRLRLVRNAVGGIAAALPWVGLGLGLWEAYGKMREQVVVLGKTKDVLATSLDASAILRDLGQATSALPWILLMVGVAGVVVVLLLHVLRRNALLRYGSLLLVAGMFIAALVLPSMPENVNPASVTTFRDIGAFSMIVLDILLLFAFLASLALLSRGSGFAVATLLIVILFAAPFFNLSLFAVARVVTIVFFVLALLALLSWKWRLSALGGIIAFVAALIWYPISQPGPSATPPGSYDTLERGYADWLAARAAQREAYPARFGRKYPVFIIAAEGGGIYAAAATSAFLSRLQDLCPAFAQHVFAISAVSGGAFGATAFQSLMQGQPLAEEGCPVENRKAPGPISEKTAKVILADHLSPLLGFTVADLLNIVGDRATGLEESLAGSISEAAGPRAAGSGSDRAQPASFYTHWAPQQAAPALVLNATSVESGYRVALAPFDLDGLGGGSLYSFRRFSQDDLSLAAAAVISARFPAILPAYTVTQGGKRLNLVDGGYADASGAFTALDLFTALKDKTPDNAELRVILLTSARSTLKISELEETTARDTLSPFITLLNVRGAFWEVAVTRTTASVDPNHASDLQKLTAPPQRGATGWTAATVQVDERSFGLSLGWRISPTTQKIVSLLMGEPDLCPDQTGSATQPATEPQVSTSAHEQNELHVAARTLIANSCVMHSIVDLLGTPETAVTRH